MMSPPPLLSVVVPTHDHGDLLAAALDSLAAQVDPPPFEVIVVDDGSTDDTAAVLERWVRGHPRFPLRVIHQPNGGVNDARNRGVLASHGATIVLLDADERAPSDHLRRIGDHLDDDPRLAGVGGPARGVDTAHLRTCGRCVIGDATVTTDADGMTGRLLGGNMAVRRSLFTAVGMFDPDLSGRGDEVEWFERAQRRFRYDPTLVVAHTRADTTVRTLVATAVRQGRSIPTAARRMGRPWRPSPIRFGRAVGHAVRRRCVHGLVLAAREVGATGRWVSEWSRAQPSRRGPSRAPGETDGAAGPGPSAR